METELRRWIQQTPEEREHLLHLFSDLELNYKSRRDAYRARAYFAESFLNGPELVQLALSILNFDFEGEEKTVVANLKAIVEKYANLDLGIDKEVFTALLKEYRSQVDSTYLPELYQTIATEYGGNERTYVDSLYARSELTTPRGLKRFLEQDTTYQIYNDPAINLGIDLITKLFEMNMQVQQASGEIERNDVDILRLTERNMIIIPPRKVFWRKSEPMQAMWILKCSLSCYPFFPPVISVDMPMRREK